MYAAGPRVSLEIAHLRVGDIDYASRKVLWIRGGKRLAKTGRLWLPPTLLELLRSYWRWKHPRQWLFPGGLPDQPLSVKAIFSWRAGPLRAGPALPRPSTRIPCGMPSPRTCTGGAAATSARFRFCSGLCPTGNDSAVSLHVADLAVRTTTSPLELLDPLDLSPGNGPDQFWPKR